jgi:hypothetical protein
LLHQPKNAHSKQETPHAYLPKGRSFNARSVIHFENQAGYAH